jgi:TonB family protein
MKPRLFLLAVFIGCFTFGFAQRQNVYFLKNSGVYVQLRDSADIVRVVSEPDSGTTLYNVREYYKSGNIKFIGKSSVIDPVKLEGQSVSYYQSGKKQEYANYQGGRLLGYVYSYYPNGKPYVHKKFLPADVKQSTGYLGDYLILACSDSTGKQLANDGDGYYIGYDSDFKNVLEEGPVKSGFRDGKWKGNSGNLGNNIAFTEDYDNGKMILGQSVDTSHQIIKYLKRDIEPQYKGGIEEFYRFIGYNVKYPYNARKNNIQGVVITSFIVEKDGSLTNLKVLKSPDNELSAETLRVLKQSPKWIPGQQYGRPVRVCYTVPTDFTLRSR